VSEREITKRYKNRRFQQKNAAKIGRAGYNYGDEWRGANRCGLGFSGKRAI